MENVYLVCPLGLGDYFVCNALVRHYLLLAHKVFLPVVPHYTDTVSCLYSDFSNIVVVPYLGLQQEQEFIKQNNLTVINFRTIFENLNIKFSGAAGEKSVPIHWDRQMYEHFDWCFSKRYSQFRLPSNIPNSASLKAKLAPTTPYVLFHKYSSNHVGGFEIDLANWRPAAGLDPSLSIVEVSLGHTANLLDYVDLIKNAAEIHVVASSFFCLVDSLFDQTNAHLFFHDIRADAVLQVNSRWNNHRWHMVYYGEKQ